jgi:hypothetical protein
LFVFRLHVEKAGDQVDDPKRIVEAHHERLDVGRKPGRERERLVDQFLESPHARIDVDRFLRGFRQRLQQGANEPSVGLQKFGARSCDALDQQPHAGGRLRHLPDDRDGSHSMQIVGGRVILLAALQQQQHHAIAGERAVDGFDRNRPPDAERRDGHGENDRFTQRHDRKLRRER